MTGDQRLKTSDSVWKGSLLMLFSLVIGAAMAFFTSVIAARSLSVNDFGVLSLFYTIQGFLVIIASFGIPRTLAKFIPEYQLQSGFAAGRLARFGIAVALICMIATTLVYVLAAGWMGGSLYGISTFAELVPFSALVVFSTAILSVSSGLAQGYQYIGVVSFVRIASPTLSVTAILLLIYSQGVRGVLIGYFLAQSITALATLVLVLQKNPQACSGRIRDLQPRPRSEFMRYSSLSLVNNLLLSFAMWVGATVLILEANLESVGYFGIAYGFYTALILVPAAIVVPLLPKISEMSMRSPASVKTTLIHTLEYSSLLVFPLVLALGVFLEPLIGLIYGDQYLPAVGVCLFMLFSSYLSTQSNIISTFFAGTGRMRQFVLLQTAWASSFIATLFISVPAIGVEGLGLSYAVAYLVNLTICLWIVRKFFRGGLGETVLVSGLGILFLVTAFSLVVCVHPGIFMGVILVLCFSTAMIFFTRRQMRPGR